MDKCSICKSPITQPFNAFGKIVCKRCFSVELNKRIAQDEADALQQEREAELGNQKGRD